MMWRPRDFRMLFLIFFIAFAIFAFVQLSRMSPRDAVTKHNGDSTATWRAQKNLLNSPYWENYVELGKSPLKSVFPADEVLTVTNGYHVSRRAASVSELYSCYGNHAIARSPLGEGKKQETPLQADVKQYDFVVLPVGCFGGATDKCDACEFSQALINATYCGRKKLGLFLGDNFYPDGIRRRKDSRFRKDLHYKFFRFPELRMTFYATSGNHDRRPKYLYRDDLEYWKMPSLYYSSGVLESGETTIEIFAYSTNPYELEGKKAIITFAEQAKWLDAALNRSVAQWKIVMTHEPIFSAVNFGNNSESFTWIHPILKRHEVQLLVCAHVHGVFFHRVDGGYHQLISAGFDQLFRFLMVSPRPVGYSHLGVGATALLMNRDTMTVLAMNAAGNVIFRHEIPRVIDRGAVEFATQVDFKIY